MKIPITLCKEREISVSISTQEFSNATAIDSIESSICNLQTAKGVYHLELFMSHPRCVRVNSVRRIHTTIVTTLALILVVYNSDEYTIAYGAIYQPKVQHAYARPNNSISSPPDETVTSSRKYYMYFPTNFE